MAKQNFEAPPAIRAPGSGPRPVPEPPERAGPPADIIDGGGPEGRLAELLQAGGDVDLYLAKYRPRSGTSVPATHKIPLDIGQIVKDWVREDPDHRTSTWLIVALLDAWAHDMGLTPDKGRR